MHFALGSALFQDQWRIVQWAFIGGLLAMTPVLILQRTWTAVASFVPQDVDAGQTGLRSLAGQFGVAHPAVIPIDGGWTAW